MKIIRVNGEPTEVPDRTTLQDLVERLQLPPHGVAVAVNLEVVPRAQHGETPLQDGDRVELVRAVGGG